MPQYGLRLGNLERPRQRIHAGLRMIGTLPTSPVPTASSSRAENSEHFSNFARNPQHPSTREDANLPFLGA